MGFGAYSIVNELAARVRRSTNVHHFIEALSDPLTIASLWIVADGLDRIKDYILGE